MTRASAIFLVFAAAATADSVFDERVAPVLLRACLPCHDAATRSSGFAATSVESVMHGGARLGAAVTPGSPETSPLVRMLTGDQTPRMPLGKPPLAPDEIAAIRQWIAGLPPAAAKSQVKSWAFAKASTAAPPSAGEGWARGPIDRFIAARLAEKKLTPSPEAPRDVLLRRLYADLLGAPPTIEETRAFLSSSAPEAYDKLVDSLLDDPRFGERWARHWLDLARYADTQGFEADRENYHMWRYRDYVIDAFRSDKPYDRFVKEQIAGDELGTPDGRAAVGFLRLTPRFQTTNAQEFRQMTLDELTATTASVFLGLTMKCAQCHDHRYDPIPQRDFYRMQAFFNTIEMAEVSQPFPGELGDRMEAARKDAAARLREAQRRFDDYQRGLLAKLETSGVKLPEGSKPVAAAALAADEVSTESFTRPVTPRVALLEGRIGRAIANGVVPNAEDRTFTLEEKKKYLELLGFVDGNRGGRDMGSIQREIRRYAPTVHAVRNIPNDPNRPALPSTFIRVMGEFNKPGEAVQAGFPSAVEGHSDPARLTTDQFGNPRGWRLPLANWIASPENPLTARVMANRVWQHLFGAGLVATPSDFGRNGARPTHPELLDYLAVEFVKNGWSVKRLIREIVRSGAYRQASSRAAIAESRVDPGNQLLWRQNRRRLEGEIIRDKVLAVAGALNPERGGPGVFIPLPEAMRDRMTIKNLPSWIPTNGPEIGKRSIYVFQRRQLEAPLLGVMDAPVFQTSCDRRAVSTTPLQALTLMNDGFTVEQARRFAERVRREAGPDRGEQTEHAFRLAFARDPAAVEKDGAKELPLESLCRALINANEFVYVD